MANKGPDIIAIQNTLRYVSLNRILHFKIEEHSYQHSHTMYEKLYSIISLGDI